MAKLVKFVLVVAALGAVGFVSFVVGLGVAFEACDAEFGVDSSAPAGRFCNSAFGQLWIIAIFGGPWAAALLVAGAVLLGRRWQRVARASAGMLVALVIVSSVVLALRDGCTDAEYDAYQLWRMRGAQGEPPALCDSY